MPTTMHPSRRRLSNFIPFVVIGGGASGLAACLAAGRRGISTLLIEKNDRLGRKILATGGGRCNIMNSGAPVYFGDSDFAYRALAACPAGRLSDYFSSIGLCLKEEGYGRMYPATGRADSVLEAFETAIESLPVTVEVDKRLTALSPLSGGGFELTFQDGSQVLAKNVLLAGGGPASPQLGGCDDMAAIASSLGFIVTDRLPALCALETNRRPIRGLDGLRLPAKLTLLSNGKPVDCAQGEALFSKTGLSGVCAMQLAGRAAIGLENKEDMQVSLDFSVLLGVGDGRMERKEPKAPDINQKATLDKLQERRHHLGDKNVLVGAVPQKLAKKLATQTLPELARNLCDWRLSLTGIRGMRHAQVSQGGVKTDTIDPATMQTSISGLYMAGEMLNVDGDTGGYNLMFAFACGFLAGEHVK